MSDLSPESRELFRTARKDLEPSDDDRARIDRALARRLGIAAGTLASAPKTASASLPPRGPVATPLTTPPTAGGSALLGVTKWMGAILLAGAAGASLYLAAHRGPTARTPSEIATPPAHPPTPVETKSSPWKETRTLDTSPAGSDPTASTSVTDLPRSGVTPRSAPATEPAGGVVHAPPGAAGGTLAEEARLVRGADEALRVGDANRALAMLDEHARTFPNGILSEERAAERVTALCKLGRVSEAREEAQRFLRASPDSFLAESVRESCGLLDDPGGR